MFGRASLADRRHSFWPFAGVWPPSPRFVHHPLPRNCLGPDRPFDDVGVDFDAAVRHKAFQRLAPGERVADRFGGFGFSRDLAQLLFPKVKQAGDDGRGFFLAPRCAAPGILAPNLILDPPQLGHGEDRVRRGLLRRVCPAPCELDRFIAAGFGPRLGQVGIAE